MIIEEVMKKFELTESTVLKMFSIDKIQRNPNAHRVLDINHEYNSNFCRYNINKSWVWSSEIKLGEYKIALHLTVFDRPDGRFHVDMELFQIIKDIDCIQYAPEDYHLRFDRFYYDSEEEHFQQNLIQDVVFTYEFYKEMNARFSTVISEYMRIMK